MLQLCVLYVETEGSDFAERLAERGELQYMAVTVALPRLVGFVMKPESVTPEAREELVNELITAGRCDLAEVMKG